MLGLAMTRMFKDRAYLPTYCLMNTDTLATGA